MSERGLLVEEIERGGTERAEEDDASRSEDRAREDSIVVAMV